MQIHEPVRAEIASEEPSLQDLVDAGTTNIEIRQVVKTSFTKFWFGRMLLTMILSIIAIVLSAICAIYLHEQTNRYQCQRNLICMVSGSLLIQACVLYFVANTIFVSSVLAGSSWIIGSVYVHTAGFVLAIMGYYLANYKYYKGEVADISEVQVERTMQDSNRLKYLIFLAMINGVYQMKKVLNAMKKAQTRELM
jgi:Zn-dependent protease with chaperone function